MLGSKYLVLSLLALLVSATEGCVSETYRVRRATVEDLLRQKPEDLSHIVVNAHRERDGKKEQVEALAIYQGTITVDPLAPEDSLLVRTLKYSTKRGVGAAFIIAGSVVAAAGIVLFAYGLSATRQCQAQYTGDPTVDQKLFLVFTACYDIGLLFTKIGEAGMGIGGGFLGIGIPVTISGLFDKPQQVGVPTTLQRQADRTTSDQTSGTPRLVGLSLTMRF